MVGAYDGKDASKTTLNASAANCAVLPYTLYERYRFSSARTIRTYRALQSSGRPASRSR